METLTDSISLALHRSTIPPRVGVPLVRDIMVTDGLVTFRPETPMREAMAIMISRSISGAPVVESGMLLVGMISEHDCLHVIAAGSYQEEPVGERTVGQLMSTEVTAVDPELDLFGVAHLLMNKRLRRVPVVKGGIVQGQVSRRDVLKAFQAL